MLDGFTVTDAEVHFEPPCRRDGGVYILQPGKPTLCMFPCRQIPDDAVMWSNIE